MLPCVICNVFVDVITRKIGGKTYTRYLIRDSHRENGKIKHRTIANISKCSPEEINAIRLALKYKGNVSEVLVDKDRIVSEQGMSVGAVLSLHDVSRDLGILKSLGNTENARRSLWMIFSRLIEPGSKLANTRLAQTHAAVDVIGMDTFNEDDLYAALDWIASRQKSIEKRLFHIRHEGKKSHLFLYDVTSSYVDGEKNELAEYGYNRDKKKGKKQIVLGLLTDDDGYPVSIEVFKGNTQDPKTFASQIRKLADEFGCESVTMVGDRGMIKTDQIADLSEQNFFYISAITKPQINTLLNQGMIQMELFTEKICEIDNGGTRYILRKNPVRAAEIDNNRNGKVQAITDIVKRKNAYLERHVKAEVPAALNEIRQRMGKLKVSGFMGVEASGRLLVLGTDGKKMEEESMLDGCYVIRSNVPADIDSETIHKRYKDLIQVEDAFRAMKTGYLELRPLYLRKESRTRGHAFIVMLSYMIEKYISERWMDFNITVEEGIRELTSINCIGISMGAVRYNQIPKPRDIGAGLLKALNVELPDAIQCSGIEVATRKKLELKRKKH